MNKKIIKMLIVLGLFFISCKQKNSDLAIFLIPMEYKGEVIVVYDHPEGEKKEYEHGRRLYKIPNNGVLKTKFEVSYGLVYDQFFYLNNDQTRNEILQMHNTKQGDEICIYNSITSKMKIEGEDFEILGFMVCPRDSIMYYSEFSFDALKNKS